MTDKEIVDFLAENLMVSTEEESGTCDYLSTAQLKGAVDYLIEAGLAVGISPKHAVCHMLLSAAKIGWKLADKQRDVTELERMNRL